MDPRSYSLLIVATVTLASCTNLEVQDLPACTAMLMTGFRPVADQRTDRFLGKVEEDTARCRGGEKAVSLRNGPWVDWQDYWAAGDVGSLAPGSGTATGGNMLDANTRGVDGALLDLEYQRVELIKFNLFDNSGTYPDYVQGRVTTPGQAPTPGTALKVWIEMRLPEGHEKYAAVGGAGAQLCEGELLRFRTLTGICNDVHNPLMGSTGQPFARNVEFDTTYPDLGKNELVRNRHGDRLGLLKPDPQVISRKLFTRTQSQPDKCNGGHGLPGFSPAANCDYQKAPFFNVLAAFWIQFMTHDWFSHLKEGHNQSELMHVGCVSQRVNNVETPLTPADVANLGCRPGDEVDKAYVARDDDPPRFTYEGKERLARAYRTTENTVTAWWDASQLYGYDKLSRQRVKRDPADPAKLLLIAVGQRTGSGEGLGYLPTFIPSDPISPEWSGQEAAAFADNWSIGMSFYHNLFAREHNLIVDAFRQRAAATPDGDCGLRNPGRPKDIIRYKDVTANELFEVVRLVIAAEIAKIHTIEWTTQLLYDEPLFLGMNANWSGLIHNNEAASRALEKVMSAFGQSGDAKQQTQWYSVFASGPGIIGLSDTNHFGSPFNFPEEFVTVYRLHAMIPDLIEYRELDPDPNVIRNKIPVLETFQGKATAAMDERGLANWALSMGRQRLGKLTLQNDPQFLQNLPTPRLHTATDRVDVAALDLIRDREHGVPRFNEFRRQYGLRQLTSFDDFVDPQAPRGSSERKKQERVVGVLREIYGQHKCDASKVITAAQLNSDGSPINDCLGHPDGSDVDNIEDVDTVVGWLAEFPRPHGFAISETQFQVFILNASRRLFSDRFFTSSFRPEFYTNLGVEWITNNGPDGKVMEKKKTNGHEVEVSPLKRVLLRTMPELGPELDHVINAFDPWARDRDAYYALQWKPRQGAESDESFSQSTPDHP
jgi:hypothetical protein